MCAFCAARGRHVAAVIAGTSPTRADRRWSAAGAVACRGWCRTLPRPSQVTAWGPEAGQRDGPARLGLREDDGAACARAGLGTILPKGVSRDGQVITERGRSAPRTRAQTRLLS